MWIVTEDSDNWKAPRKRILGLAALIVAAALVMGLPTLRGTFVGGDDHRLALNHVLVNHPSLTHAVRLFGIVHRDLYQPLPLLSYQLEFAVANVLDLFDRGVAAGAWLFHLTNVVLHAINAVLVWIVLRSLHRPKDNRSAEIVATVTAVLFAIHPLEVEVVAWVSGRMMLLSTLFALASMAALARWLRDGHHRWAFLTVVFVACCAMSKIRVSLPLLLIIVLIALRRKVTARLAVLWLVCAAMTAAFAVVNYQATAQAGLFSGAAESLHGPKIIRAVLALAWYFEHFVWPAGLASWYPTPEIVRWSDPGTLRAAAVLIGVAAVVGWSAVRSRSATLGFAWFFVTIAAVVQLVPSRNVVAADRYMYLPIIGLLWVTAIVLWWGYEAAVRKWAPGPARIALAVPAVAVAAAMIGQSWHVASFYETPMKKCHRIADLHPDTPHVWERLAWSYYEAERYQQAIELAEREFNHENHRAWGDAYQVIGMAHFRLGNHDAAIESLHHAIDAHPEDTQTKYHLAQVLEDVGQSDEALRLLEESVADAPLANPRLLRLASLYRRLGRLADARRTYEQVLRNNPFDVRATMNLADLDIQVGTSAAYRTAEKRLAAMLEWMPENADGWVNLGVVHRASGSTSKAIEAYRRALSQDPRHAAAALNLAVVYEELGETGEASPLFARAVESGLESIAELSTVHDFYVARGRTQQLATLWDEFLTRHPDSADGHAFRAWSRALAGHLPQARLDADTLCSTPPVPPLARATLAFIALIEGQYLRAARQTDLLCAMGPPGTDARQRLLGRLEVFSQQRPGSAWTYCLASELLIAEGQLEGAQLGVELCDQRCQEQQCRERVTSLRARLPGAPSSSTAPSPDTP